MSILNMKNADIYNTIVQLHQKDLMVKLSVFVEPWVAQGEIVKKNHMLLFKPVGKYFAFLRWLAFKCIHEGDEEYLNDRTLAVLIFLEEQCVTGIFAINRGKLFDLLTLYKCNGCFDHAGLTTISNSQLFCYIKNHIE
tara:strand:- start:647 stop:1060 length:414 start_codon:yes stop_codon:yes gene_type:complete